MTKYTALAKSLQGPCITARCDSVRNPDRCAPDGCAFYIPSLNV